MSRVICVIMVPSLFFFRSHVPCQTQESCAQLHVILMFRVRFVICQGEKQRFSLEPAGRSPEDGALLSQAQESRSQSRASASILCVSSGEFIVFCPDHVDLSASYIDVNRSLMGSDVSKWRRQESRSGKQRTM